MILPQQQSDSGSITLIRHGETKFNKETGDSSERIRGHLDIPLDDTGRKEAANIGDKLADSKISKIYTSDLSRAKDTADIIASKLPNKPKVVSTFNLRPWKLGSEIEGKETSKVKSRIDNLVDNPDTKPKDGESFNTFKTRASNSFEQIKNQNINKDIAVITHYRVIKLIGSTNSDNSIDSNKFKESDANVKPGSFQVIPNRSSYSTPIMPQPEQSQPPPLMPQPA